MQLSALLFPHSDYLRERVVFPRSFWLKYVINMFICWWPSHAFLNLLFFFFFWENTITYKHALQLSQPNQLFHRPAVIAHCFNSQSVTIYTSLKILNTLACTTLTEGHHKMRLNSNINCQIFLILNYDTQTSLFGCSVWSSENDIHFNNSKMLQLCFNVHV